MIKNVHFDVDIYIYFIVQKWCLSDDGWFLDVQRKNIKFPNWTMRQIKIRFSTKPDGLGKKG